MTKQEDLHVTDHEGGLCFDYENLKIVDALSYVGREMSFKLIVLLYRGKNALEFFHFRRERGFSFKICEFKVRTKEILHEVPTELDGITLKSDLETGSSHNSRDNQGLRVSRIDKSHVQILLSTNLLLQLLHLLTID